MYVNSLSLVRLFVTPWSIIHQALLSMGFFRQEYWSGFPFPSPGDLPKPGIEPRSPALQADFLPSEPPGNPMDREAGYNPQGRKELDVAKHTCCSPVSMGLCHLSQTIFKHL